MIPSPGRIVEYTLSEEDVNRIALNRGTRAGSNQGNFVSLGDKYPMVIVRCWGSEETSLVNGQVLLDGSDTLWVTSVGQGEGHRTWRPYQKV